MNEKNIIRIGTFNLLNLTVPEMLYYNKQKISGEDFSRKKAWINQQLDAMNADIVGFQELFHESALRNILNDNPNYENARIVVGHNKEGLPSVGLFSRFPITDFQVFNEFPEQLVVDGLTIPFTNFSRPVLKCTVQVRPDLHFIVVVAHLKSKRPMIADGADGRDPVEVAKGQARSLLMRSAEANALRTVLMNVLKERDYPVIVMGDLNDTHNSVTTRIISGDPPFRHMPMERKLEIWDTLLYHVKDIQARMSYSDVYFTHIYNGHYEALDHIMVSQELVKENPKNIGRVGSVRVFNDHLIDETLSGERVPNWQSDHGQVVVSIELNDPK
jgi:endonuclease/exonuclease/phosphatase family metal-dependent hydrolase